MEPPIASPEGQPAELHKKMQELQRSERTMFLLGAIVASGIVVLAVCVYFFCGT